MPRPRDGEQFHQGDHYWNVCVDESEDGTHSWVECDDCGETVPWGDEGRMAHVCPTTDD